MSGPSWLGCVVRRPNCGWTGRFGKSCGLLCGRELEPERAFAVIDAEKASHSIIRMAELLAVSRSGTTRGPRLRGSWRICVPR